MINHETFLKMTYGLFTVCSGDKNNGNGIVSNTLFQVTSEPPCSANCYNKNNYTAEFIQKSKNFSVSIIKKDIDPRLFGKFGFRTGRDIDKFEGLNMEYGKSGAPIVLNDTLAFL
ncbi:MAG: flavin reductase [Bacteroidota bacterium]